MQTLTDSPPVAASQLKDIDITAAIERRFITNKGVVSPLIEVTTRDGVVELTGATDSLLSRRRAEEIALAVRGVRGVINELVVKAEDVPDSVLGLNVQHALADDPACRDYNLHCTVAGGTVWLSGTVQSWAEKQLALRVVEGVRGVRHVVHDQLTISRSGPEKSDLDLTTQLRELLEWDVRVNPKLVQVSTTAGVVELRGAVGSAAGKTHLENLAFELGARRVDARDLRVEPRAQVPGLRGAEDVPCSEEEIMQAVDDTLARDPRLRDQYPEVQLHEGTVTLLGCVDNLRARQAAEQDAGHVAGVAAVDNQLKVRPNHGWTDADLRQRVAAALHRDPYLNTYNFSVTVLNSRATVYGWVENRFEQEQVYEVASGVNGVVDVENRVNLYTDGQAAARALAGDLTGALALPERPAALRDQDLAEGIRRRYFWNASLHNQPIGIEVSDGRVTLTGSVDSWPKYQQAVRDAYELGARDVNNHLHVRPASSPTPAPESSDLIAPLLP